MEGSDKNVLLTGGAGNIASSLAAVLCVHGYRVVVVDNLLTGSLSKLPNHNNLAFYQCDVNDKDALATVFKAHAFSHVFHFAAVVGVKRTLENPLLVLSDIRGIENILELSRLHGVKHVFYSSSSEVYGEPFEVPQNENTTPLNSRLPYAVVKNVGEVYVKAYFKEYGINYTIFRFFNTYGPNQSDDFVVPRFLKKALNGEDLEIYGDGLQTRSFCFVDDNVETCFKAMTDSVALNNVINIGSDKEITILELAHKIVQVTNSSSKIKFLPPLPEGDMTRRCPDISRMRLILNRDLTSLEAGLQKMLLHYQY